MFKQPAVIHDKLKKHQEGIQKPLLRFKEHEYIYFDVATAAKTAQVPCLHICWVTASLSFNCSNANLPNR